MSFVTALEEEATLQLQAIRDYRTSTDPGVTAGAIDIRNRAKSALGVIGAYVRLGVTLANEKSNELIERRLGLTVPAQRMVADGPDAAHTV